jgi:hypothetical protein
MQVVVNIKDCSDCCHLGHSGAFTPGGAKSVCGHDYAVDHCPNKNAKGKDRWHWKYRVLNPEKTPDWCPLKHGRDY